MHIREATLDDVPGIALAHLDVIRGEHNPHGRIGILVLRI